MTFVDFLRENPLSVCLVGSLVWSYLSSAKLAKLDHRLDKEAEWTELRFRKRREEISSIRSFLLKTSLLREFEEIQETLKLPIFKNINREQLIELLKNGVNPELLIAKAEEPRD